MAIVVAIATAIPKPRPMAIALMVPEARPISQPPESAGVPHWGFLAFAIRMPRKAITGMATAVARPARHPAPPAPMDVDREAASVGG